MQFRMGIYKKQKRQDWDHKAYHDAPSAIYIYIQVNEKILQIIKGNIGMVKKQRETRQGWIVHNG